MARYKREGAESDRDIGIKPRMIQEKTISFAVSFLPSDGVQKDDRNSIG